MIIFLYAYFLLSITSAQCMEKTLHVLSRPFTKDSPSSSSDQLVSQKPMPFVDAVKLVVYSYNDTEIQKSITMIKNLLKDGSYKTINQQDSHGNTGLYYAAIALDKTIAQYSKKNKEKYYHAIKYYNKIIKAMFKSPVVDFSLKNGYQETASKYLKNSSFKNESFYRTELATIIQNEDFALTVQGKIDNTDDETILKNTKAHITMACTYLPVTEYYSDDFIRKMITALFNPNR